MITGMLVATRDPGESRTIAPLPEIDMRGRYFAMAIYAMAVLFNSSLALAQEWKAKYPELVFAIVPSENASAVTDRWTPFTAYLSRELGVKVSLRVAADYAAVIEGQRSGNIHIASFGPASFARARLIGVKADAFAVDVTGDGSKGYYSVFYVLAKSPYKSLEDLKGKNIGFVDPNSTSGYNMPMFTLDKHGIVPDAYFGKSLITGSHENAVLALVQGTVDVAANGWFSDSDNHVVRMIARGMLKNADGSPMKYEDFRIIAKSDLIVNDPLTYLSDLPNDLKAKIRTAIFDFPAKDKAAYDKLDEGKGHHWEAIDNSAYDDTIHLIKFVDSLRKRKS
jgi:phosphonate transport system substrate-binding protein